jgi:hypothetical protein
MDGRMAISPGAKLTQMWRAMPKFDLVRTGAQLLSTSWTYFLAARCANPSSGRSNDDPRPDGTDDHDNLTERTALSKSSTAEDASHGRTFGRDRS